MSHHRFYDRIDHASDNAFNILKKYQPCNLKPYSVDKYRYYVGYNHRVSTYHDETPQPITQEQADNFFKEDLNDTFMRIYEIPEDIRNNDKIILNQNQVDALVCYVFAIGEMNWMEFYYPDRTRHLTTMQELRELILGYNLPTKPDLKDKDQWWYQGAVDNYYYCAEQYINQRIPDKSETFFYDHSKSYRCGISEYGHDTIDKLVNLFHEIQDLFSIPDPTQIIIKDNPYPHINPHESLSILHPGEHDYIKWVQFEMSRTQLFTIDGKFTRDFQEKLMSFQKELGLEETGIID
jgi:GH24 family phage-related lysozyme (muramidase)